MQPAHSIEAVLNRLPMNPVSRFAPSPTGFLHLGHLAHMIFVWGITRALGGTIILRMEDHDQSRCKKEYELAILEDLEWLGFAPDAGQPNDLRAGACAYRQSDCERRYRRMLERLRSDGLLYGCTCSRAEIVARTRQSEGESYYDGYCAGRQLPEGNDVGLRIRLPEETLRIDDAWLGTLTQTPQKECGDVLVRDRHGNWTYHFAVVCDDLEQKVNLVIRGEDLVDSTGRQILMGQALGRGSRPFYLHHKLIKDAAGRKMSKRDFGVSLRDLRNQGISATALLGEAAARVELVTEPRPLAVEELAGLFQV